MRTINRCRQIVCFDYHVQRLSSSTDAMIHEHLNPGSLSNRILENIRNGISLFDEKDENLTIAVLVPTEGHDMNNPVPIWLHLSPFRHKQRLSVTVEGMRASRKQFGTTKDSLWAKMRQDLLKAKHSDVNEVVLIDDDDRLLEGLSSNVFVVNAEGRLQTAPVADGIIAGTIREVLLAACKANQIEVVEQSPDWNQRRSWKGAFLTSTSRLVLPIHEILDSVSGDDSVKFAAIPEIIHRCCELTETDIGKHCRNIYD